MRVTATRLVVVAVLASTATVTLLAIEKRRRVALNAHGAFWCIAGSCEPGECAIEQCVEQESAACFSSRVVMTGHEGDDCRRSMTACEEARGQASKSPEFEDVGSCRVVSAAARDRDRYLMYALLTKVGGGLLLLVALAALIRRHRRRHPRSPADDEWREKLKSI